MIYRPLNTTYRAVLCSRLWYDLYFCLVTIGSYGIIHLVSTRNFPKNCHLVPPDTHTVCLSVTRWQFFGKVFVCIKWMIPIIKSYFVLCGMYMFCSSNSSLPRAHAYTRPCQTYNGWPLIIFSNHDMLWLYLV